MTRQFAYPPDREEASAKKAAALESLLIEKGVITPQTVDKVLAYFATEMTPLNGKKIVVKAWTDPEFAEKIVVDTTRGHRRAGFPRGHGGCRR
jgi:nitrile hydratase